MLNLGDRVRVIALKGQTDYFSDLFKGKEGVVTSVGGSNVIWSIDVTFDTPIDGTQSMCFNEDELELVNV
jgi:hypothetical protein